MLIPHSKPDLATERIEAVVSSLEHTVAAGYSLNGVEGMACQLPVVSNFEDQAYTLPLRGRPCLDECPIVSASPESIDTVLRELVMRPELRSKLGATGRRCVEKFHGLNSPQYLFGAVVDHLEGRRESLMDLYHPLVGEHPRRAAKVEHPLVDNKIVD